MIELSPAAAFMLYLGFTLVILLGLWLGMHLQHRKRKLLLDRSQLFVCEYCHNAYLDEVHASVTRCPRCQSYNRMD